MFIDLNCFLRWAMWPMGLLLFDFVIVHVTMGIFCTKITYICAYESSSLQKVFFFNYIGENFYTPRKVWEVYSGPYVRQFVRSSIRPSVPIPLRPLNRISWNFQELWCHTAPPILSFNSNDFGVSLSKTRTLPYKTLGSGGIILWALLTVFLVVHMFLAY